MFNYFKNKKQHSPRAGIVAAFDFGTTYSGYAYSFEDHPNEVKTNKHWTSGCGKLISHKTPTCVLLNKTNEFDSFGFTAEDKYSSLAAKNQHHGWRLFRRFKMVLHNENSTTVTDLEGKAYPAMPIFAMSIQYLQRHLLDALNMSKVGLCETDIKYIITVPAIWGIAAKQFMREAAIEAGIDGDRLKLALEPEAAAVCCEALEPELTGQFMVVDIGGGTADISVHEKQANGTLKNIYAPSGGPWGGNCVDENFAKFLSEVFGTEALLNLNANKMYDYFDVIQDFEVKKRKFGLDPETDGFDSGTDMTFRIPAALNGKALKIFSVSLSSRVSGSKYGQKLSTMGKDKLGVHWSIMQSWFVEPVSEILNHIKRICQEERLRDVGLIFLVGGFAESPYVQQRIQRAIPNKRLIVPEEAGLAVLKGAVMFGHKPDIISSRVMDYTFGISVCDKFDKQKYAVEKKEFNNRQRVVDHVFEIFVKVNDDVPVGSKVTRITTPTKTRSIIPIYRTKERDPVYTTDPGCELLGTVTIENDKDIPLTDQKKETTFMFGDTELLIEHKNIRTGKVQTLTLEINKKQL